MLPISYIPPNSERTSEKYSNNTHLHPRPTPQMKAKKQGASKFKVYSLRLYFLECSSMPKFFVSQEILCQISRYIQCFFLSIKHFLLKWFPFYYCDRYELSFIQYNNNSNEKSVYKYSSFVTKTGYRHLILNIACIIHRRTHTHTIQLFLLIKIFNYGLCVQYDMSCIVECRVEYTRI